MYAALPPAHLASRCVSGPSQLRNESQNPGTSFVPITHTRKKRTVTSPRCGFGGGGTRDLFLFLFFIFTLGTRRVLFITLQGVLRSHVIDPAFFSLAPRVHSKSSFSSLGRTRIYRVHPPQDPERRVGEGKLGRADGAGEVGPQFMDPPYTYSNQRETLKFDCTARAFRWEGERGWHATCRDTPKKEEKKI